MALPSLWPGLGPPSGWGTSPALICHWLELSPVPIAIARDAVQLGLQEEDTGFVDFISAVFTVLLLTLFTR